MSKELAKEKRRKRQGTRVLLQVFPLMIGFVGLYFISSWSMVLRIDAPGHSSISYYLGLALVLFALQLPIILEVNRRRTKRFKFRNVVLGFIAMLVLLVGAAMWISPSLDMDDVQSLDNREWNSIEQHDNDDDNDDDDTGEYQ